MIRSIFLLLPTLAFMCFQTPDLKPTTTQALVKVVVVNDKNVPQASQLVTFTSMKDGRTYTGTTDAAGKFSLLMPPAQKYKVKYKTFNTETSNLDMDLPTKERPYTFTYTLTVTPPKTFTLNNVFFDSGKSTLRPESDKELKDLVEYLELKKTVVIEIAGHTDNVGSAQSNQKLSEDRANAIKQYLQKKGIEPGRITAKGYGDTQPAADNNSAAGKQRNRRIEVHIISE